MKVEDLRQRGAGWSIRLHEKGGKYFSNDGALNHAQEIAAHDSPRTTKLYDRTKERLTQDEVERIRL